MTPQTITHNDTTPDKAKQAFDLVHYGSILLVLLVSYLAMLTLFVTFLLVTGQQAQAVLDAMLVTTLFYLLATVLVTGWQKPAYTSTFKVKPLHVSGIATLLGALTLAVVFVLRQTDEESRLRVMLISAILVLIGGAVSMGLNRWQAKHKDSIHDNAIAFFLAVAGTLAAALLGPALLRLNEPVLMLRVALLIMMYGLALFIALAVLHQITTSNVKSTTIPDGHAGIVKSKGRIERISFEKSVDVKLEGEEFEKHDLRLHSDEVNMNACMTLDHVPASIQASVEWKPINTEAGLRAYFTHSSDPESSMKSLLRAAIVSEIGARGSSFICGREEHIAANVMRRVRGMARDYGMQVVKVGITQALLKHPMPGQSISPLAEASRLQQMDSAIRGVSMATVQHAESLSRAQAGAANNAGGKAA